jgi:hypothetical protein
VSVLRHSPEEYAKRAAACVVASKLAAGSPRADELRAEVIYNIALCFEALAWRKLAEQFKPNYPKTS